MLSIHKKGITSDEDKRVLALVKEAITVGIEHFKEKGIREANVEIELVHHVKTELKKGAH